MKIDESMEYVQSTLMANIYGLEDPQLLTQMLATLQETLSFVQNL